MAKIGKYSTGAGGKGPKSAPYQNSNMGYGGKRGLMKEFRSMEPRQKPNRTTTGAAPDPEQIRPRSR